MPRILADSATLMQQASMTVNDYLIHAQDSIDRVFGVGYAAEHPELVAACVKAAALDLGTALVAGAIEELAEATTGLGEIATGLGEIAAAIRERSTEE